MATSHPNGNDEPTEAPDPADVTQDPAELRAAHAKYGQMLRKAGLPFDEDEFEDGEAGTDGESSASSDSTAGPATD
jgi:hypothetical protein